MRITILMLFAFSAVAQTTIPATDLTAADIQAFVKALPRDAVNDRPIRVVDAPDTLTNSAECPVVLRFWLRCH